VNAASPTPKSKMAATASWTLTTPRLPPPPPLQTQAQDASPETEIQSLEIGTENEIPTETANYSASRSRAKHQTPQHKIDRSTLPAQISTAIPALARTFLTSPLSPLPSPTVPPATAIEGTTVATAATDEVADAMTTELTTTRIVTAGLQTIRRETVVRVQIWTSMLRGMPEWTSNSKGKRVDRKIRGGDCTAMRLSEETGGAVAVGVVAEEAGEEGSTGDK
jgi:hypothetical protein